MFRDRIASLEDSIKPIARPLHTHASPHTHANPSYPNNQKELVPGPADYDPAEWRREARQHVP